MKNLPDSVQVWKQSFLFLRACAPVSMGAIANELRIQCPGVTRENCEAVARKFISDAVDRGALKIDKIDPAEFAYYPGDWD